MNPNVICRRGKTMRCTLCCLAFAALCLTISSVTAAEDNPLAPYLEVPGAATTLPVGSATSPFSLEFAQDAQKRFEKIGFSAVTRLPIFTYGYDCCISL